MVQCRGHPILGIELAVDRLVADLTHPAITIVDRSAAHIANLNRVRPELLRAALLVPWLVSALPRPNDRLTAHSAVDVPLRLRISTRADIAGFTKLPLPLPAILIPGSSTRLAWPLTKCSMPTMPPRGATLVHLG